MAQLFEYDGLIFKWERKMIDHSLPLDNFKPRSALVTMDNTTTHVCFPVVGARNHLPYEGPAEKLSRKYTQVDFWPGGEINVFTRG
jgi:hypothetical protein